MLKCLWIIVSFLRSITECCNSLATWLGRLFPEWKMTPRFLILVVGAMTAVLIFMIGKSKSGENWHIRIMNSVIYSLHLSMSHAQVSLMHVYICILFCIIETSFWFENSICICICEHDLICSEDLPLSSRVLMVATSTWKSLPFIRRIPRWFTNPAWI